MCNHLSLTGRITLNPKQSMVSDEYLANVVFTELFQKLKEDEVQPILDAVKQLATGLDISVRYTSVGGFHDSVGRKIFSILNIPLYHGWVLHPKEAETINAIGGRSYDSLTCDLSMYKSVGHTNKDPLDPLAVDSSDANTTHSLDHGYTLISKFLEDTCSQLTRYGLSCLQESIPDRQLAVFFRNNHFSIVYKYDGRLYNLQTDEGYLNLRNIWQRLDDISGGGIFVASDYFIPSDGRLSLSSARSDFKSANVYKQQGPDTKFQPVCKQQRHDKRPSSVSKEQRHGSQPQTVRPSLAELMSMPGSSSSEGLITSHARSQVGTGASSSDMSRQYASFLTKERDEKMEAKLLAFLRGYKENGIQYYKQAVHGMMVLQSREMRIHYDHIMSYDAELAEALRNCFERIRNNMNRATKMFIQDFKQEFKFECEKPIVRICDLPKPDERWMPLKKFLSLPGNHPAEDDYIYCGESFLLTRKSTPIGRVILSNILVKLVRTHLEGNSWNGEWTADDVVVSDQLQIEIAKPHCFKCTHEAIYSDFLISASELIPLFEMDGRLPGFFKHLRNSLRRFIPSARFSRGLLQKFQRFITTHQALRPPMANLAFYDDIYNVHQAISPRAKSVLQSILNSQPLKEDWRSIFLGDANANALPGVLESVYQFNKVKLAEKADKSKLCERDGQDEDGDDSGFQGEEPFAEDAEGQMIFARHVRHHGPKGSKNEYGQQSIRRLSEIDMVLSHFLWMLPETMERLICDDTGIDSYEPFWGRDAYTELMGMLDEIFESYNRPELPELQVLLGPNER